MKRPRRVPSRLPRPGLLVVLLVLAIGLMGIGGCRGRSGAGTPTGAPRPYRVPGSPATPEGWLRMVGTAQTVESRPGVVSTGPFRQVALMQWAGPDRVLAVARREGGGEFLIRLDRDPIAPTGWRGLVLATFGGEGEGFYQVAGMGEGPTALVSTPRSWFTWRLDGAERAPREAQLTALSRGVYFDVSPDRARAVLHPGDLGPTELMLFDLASGAVSPWPAAGSAVAGAGASWSPDGSRYLYLERAAGGTGLGLAVWRAAGGAIPSGESVARLAPEGRTLFWAAWSPDAALVAFAYLNGEPAPHLPGPEGDGTPVRAHGLGLWNPSSGEVAWLELPGRLIYSMPCWSPDGGEVAFAAGGPPDPGDSEGARGCPRDTWIARRAGVGWGTAFQLSDAANDGYQVEPLAWSRDGEALVAAAGLPRSAGPRRYSVFEIAAETGDLTPPPAPVPIGDFTWLRDCVSDPVWLDEGRLLLARRLAGGSEDAWELVICGRDGSTLRVLDAPARAGEEWSRLEFAVSPDGRRVAWTRERAAEAGGETRTVLYVTLVGRGP